MPFQLYLLFHIFNSLYDDIPIQYNINLVIAYEMRQYSNYNFFMFSPCEKFFIIGCSLYLLSIYEDIPIDDINLAIASDMIQYSNHNSWVITFYLNDFNVNIDKRHLWLSEIQINIHCDNHKGLFELSLLFHIFSVTFWGYIHT